MPKPFTPKVVTANALLEGDVVYLSDADTWTRDLREAALLTDEADAALRACVAETTSPLLGAVMELGVRAGGHPVWPTPWRWGYGRESGSGYVEPVDAARER